MKIFSPATWRSEDEKYYTFSRNSGLPYGYFDPPPRRPFWVALWAVVLLAALVLL